MAFIPNLCVLLLLYTYTGQSGSMPPWVNVSPEDSSYSVQLPKKYTRESKERVLTPGVKVQMTHYVAKSKSGQTAYLFSVSRVEEGVVPPEPELNRLNRIRAQYTNKGKKVVSEEKLQLNNHPGMGMVIDLGNKKFMRVQIYSTRNRIYQQIILGAKEDLRSPVAERYFDSLQIQR